MATITITVPDAAVPKIKAVFGGNTNQETIAAVRAALTNFLRVYVIDALKAQQEDLSSVNLVTAKEQVEIDVQGVWP